MLISELLRRIDAHEAATGESDRALSLRAGGSPDMIRNLRRATALGQEPGAHITKVSAVLRAIGAMEGLAEPAPPFAAPDAPRVNMIEFAMHDGLVTVQATIDRRGVARLREKLDLIEKLFEP